MPLYVLVARDLPGLKRRQQVRPAHLEHMDGLEAAGRVRYGGPLLNKDREMVGSLIILEAENLEEAKATYGRDPYVTQDVFDHYDVIETLQVYPKP